MIPQSRVSASSQDVFSVLLEIMANDLNLHAMQIASVAAIVSAAARPDSTISPRSCRHLLGDNGKAMRLALKYGTDLGLPVGLITRLDELYAEAADLKTALRSIVEAPFGPHMSSRVQEQASRWRKAADETCRAIDMFTAAAKSRLSAVYAQDALSVRKTLQRAAQGDPSLIDNSNVLRLPPLQQRRRSPRLTVHRTCTVHLPTGAVRAQIEDISREGLGIVCALPLRKEQKLQITLDDGTTVEAVVARASGSSYGLSLTKPLPNYNQVLKEALN